MKKCVLLYVLAVAFMACNNKQPQYCDSYPYCISDYSIHPENWLCGRLKPEPSPFDENDTVVAMAVKYVYSSDMNGMTYFITRNKELFSLLDESGKRKESIEMNEYKGKNFMNMPFVLYPYKSIEELPSPEILSNGVLKSSQSWLLHSKRDMHHKKMRKNTKKLRKR